MQRGHMLRRVHPDQREPSHGRLPRVATSNSPTPAQLDAGGGRPPQRTNAALGLIRRFRRVRTDVLLGLAPGLCGMRTNALLGLAQRICGIRTNALPSAVRRICAFRTNTLPDLAPGLRGIWTNAALPALRSGFGAMVLPRGRIGRRDVRFLDARMEASEESTGLNAAAGSLRFARERGASSGGPSMANGFSFPGQDKAGRRRAREGFAARATRFIPPSRAPISAFQGIASV